jgi:hypothetical protein
MKVVRTIINAVAIFIRLRLILTQTNALGSMELMTMVNWRIDYAEVYKWFDNSYHIQLYQ